MASFDGQRFMLLDGDLFVLFDGGSLLYPAREVLEAHARRRSVRRQCRLSREKEEGISRSSRWIPFRLGSWTSWQNGLTHIT